MPSARQDQMADLGVVPAPACLTRYDFTEAGVRFDCPTLHVDADPHHWVTTCPAPPVSNPALPSYQPPPDRDEVALDGNGRLIREIETRAVPLNGQRPVDDVAYIYDVAGRLQERILRDEHGTEIIHSVVTQRDAGGRPVAVSTTRLPLVHLGVTYWQTAQLDETLGYDAIGRLTSQQRRLTATGDLEWDMTVSYDDAALRRDYMIIVDTPYLPNSGGPGRNPFYELLDADGRVIEYGCEDNCTADDEPPWFVNHVYDEDGRVVMDSYVGAMKGLLRSYVYDCP